MPKDTKKFNGKIYRLHDTRSRRFDADRIADWLRSRGKLVRVTGDYRTGYDIWVR